MIYMLDSANLESIKKAFDLYPISGVTTNPTIISKEKKPFFEILKNIREIIGENKMLHVQVLSISAEEMVEEAHLIHEKIGGNLYIKIPVTPEGIKAIKLLSKENIKTTATAIITSQQALMAATAGAEYLAPYVNRIENICGDSKNVIKDIAKLLEVTDNTYSKILGASFKNVKQVNTTILAGAKSITINKEVMDRLLYHPLSDLSVETFISDWEEVYGNKKTILNLE